MLSNLLGITLVLTGNCPVGMSWEPFWVPIQREKILKIDYHNIMLNITTVISHLLDVLPGSSGLNISSFSRYVPVGMFSWVPIYTNRRNSVNT